MSLRFICFELRENLGCANVFLQFDSSLTQIKSLKINIKVDELVIKSYSKDDLGCILSFDLSKYFCLDTRTLSNLSVEKLNASFRFSFSSLKEHESVKTNRVTVIEPLFKVGQQGTFVCVVCTCPLMSTETIVRVREFPTGAIDSSEFFCHAATEFKNILIPRVCDFYYGSDFIVVNSELLESSTKLKSNHVYCGRCLKHLGEVLFNGKATKLWVDSLKLKCEDNEEPSDILTMLTVPKLIQKIVDDCTDVNERLHSMSFAKVLLSTSNSDRSTKYLMLQILEKELKILRNERPIDHNDYYSSVNNNNVQKEELIEYKSFKVLYRFIKEFDYENYKSRLPALLQFWQQDTLIQSLKISPTTFCNLLNELEENSMLIPEFYRFNKDDFKLSYVFYKD